MTLQAPLESPPIPKPVLVELMPVAPTEAPVIAGDTAGDWPVTAVVLTAILVVIAVVALVGWVWSVLYDRRVRRRDREVRNKDVVLGWQVLKNQALLTTKDPDELQLIVDGQLVTSDYLTEARVLLASPLIRDSQDPETVKARRAIEGCMTELRRLGLDACLRGDREGMAELGERLKDAITYLESNPS